VNVVMNLQVSKKAGNVACFLHGRAKDLSAPLYSPRQKLSKRKVWILIINTCILACIYTSMCVCVGERTRASYPCFERKLIKVRFELDLY